MADAPKRYTKEQRLLARAALGQTVINLDCDIAIQPTSKLHRDLTTLCDVLTQEDALTERVAEFVRRLSSQRATPDEGAWPHKFVTEARALLPELVADRIEQCPDCGRVLRYWDEDDNETELAPSHGARNVCEACINKRPERIAP